MLRAMLNWTTALPLGNYNFAVVGPGLYVIGTCPNAVPPGPGVADLNFGVGWPANFMPVYVGISESPASQSAGMRKRLSAHSRGKGSKKIAAQLLAVPPVQFYFIQAPGIAATAAEALFILQAVGQQLQANVRPEVDRSLAKMAKKAFAAQSPEARIFFEELDMGNTEGM